MAMSHANCTHPRTPAGRRACRAGNAAPVATKIVNGEIRDTCSTCRKNVVRVGNTICWACEAVAPIEKEIARAKMNQAARRKMAAPVRIQPRRVPTRVVRDSSGCVQAALHNGGRCACGYHAANFCNPAVWACAGH